MEKEETGFLLPMRKKDNIFAAMEMSPTETVEKRIVINRRPQTAKEFNDTYGNATNESNVTIFERVQRKLACSKSCPLTFFLSVLPIITWLRRYQRKWIVGDLVAGLTVGVVHIPQSLAFSILTGLPPVFGLYTSFYPVIFYTIMGTSKHVSIGTFAVTSLMTRNVLDRLVPLPTVTNATLTLNATDISSIGVPGITDIDVERVKIATAVAFLVGVFQLIFGVFRLGIISSYMSTPLVQAFTTGSAVHVVTSQAPSVLGIQVASFSGSGAFFRNWVEIFKNLPNTHIATLIISVVCIILLTTGREINLRFKDKMKMPLPTEVIVVIIAILASHFGSFERVFDVVIVKNVPTGLPPPVLPNMGILQSVIADSFAIAIVAFAINISLAKLFATQKGYTIDPNQELIAYGMANIIPSFFLCFVSAGALARCAIQVNAGGNTQVVGILSVIVVLIVVLILGPVFEPLPRSVLGSIIIVGLLGILAQIANIKPLYKTSKVDCSIFVVTFLCVVILGVDIGLLAGVIYSILTVIGRTQLPRTEVLVNVGGTEVYKSVKGCAKDVQDPDVLIFRFYSGIYYANKDIFKNKLKHAIDSHDSSKQDLRVANRDDANIHLDIKQKNYCYVILDCSAVTFVDLGGVIAIKETMKELENKGTKLLLTSCNDDMVAMLMKQGFMEEAGEESIFISLHDAVVFASGRNNNL